MDGSAGGDGGRRAGVGVSGAVETADRAAHVERAVRALGISGRRLVKTSVGWSVLGGGDRRRRARLLLDEAEVQKLAGDGKLVASGGDEFMLAGVGPREALNIEPWAFIAAGMRRSAREAGFGFTALAMRARKGDGPLTMRHVNAGLRLIADAERRETSRGLTMDWDAGPVDRQRRSGGKGGLRGAAAEAGKRLRRVKALLSEDDWALAWAVCIEGLSLRAAMHRFAIGQRNVGKTIAEALEAVALAYES